MRMYSIYIQHIFANARARVHKFAAPSAQRTRARDLFQYFFCHVTLYKNRTQYF